MKGHVCLFKLFGGCLRFLRKSNGGDPEPSIFRWSHPAEDEQHSHVDTPLGLDPSSLDDLARGVDGLHVALKFRGLLPGLSVPIGFADRDNVLLIFEHGPREGESGSRSRTRFHWEEYSDPGVGMYFVAPSFNAFLGLLRQEA